MEDFKNYKICDSDNPAFEVVAVNLEDQTLLMPLTDSKERDNVENLRALLFFLMERNNFKYMTVMKPNSDYGRILIDYYLMRNFLLFWKDRLDGGTRAKDIQLALEGMEVSRKMLLEFCEKQKK